MKALKIIAIVVVVLVLLVVLALAVIPSLIPVQSMIAENLEKSTGRPVKLGSASLGLLGGLSFDLDDLEVGEKPKYGQRPLLKVKTVRLRAQLLPLLASKLVVDELTVDGLEASVVRAKDGGLNLTDLPAPAGEKVEVGRPEPGIADPEGGDFDFLLTQARVGGKVYFHNLGTGQSGELPLEDCRLKVSLSGARVDADLAVKMPGLSLLGSTGQSQDPEQLANFTMDLDLARLGAPLAVVAEGLVSRGVVKLDSQVRGPLDAIKVLGQMTAKDLYVSHPAMTAGAFSLKDLSLNYDLAQEPGGRQVEVKTFVVKSQDMGYEATLSGVFGAEGNLEATDAAFKQTVDLARMAAVLKPLFPQIEQAAGKVVKEAHFKGAGPQQLILQGSSIGEGLVIQLAGMPQPYRDPDPKATFSILVDLGEDAVKINSLDLKMALASLLLTGEIQALDDDRARINLKLTSEELDLGTLAALAQGASGTQPAPASQRPPSQSQSAPAPAQAEAAPSPAPAGEDASAQAAQLREALAKVDARLILEVGRVVYKDLEATDLNGEITVKDKVAAIDSLVCKPLGGDFQMSASLDAAPATPQGKLQMKVDKISLEKKNFAQLQEILPILAWPLGRVSGTFNFTSDLAWTGLDPDAVMQAMKGGGVVQAPDGVEVGFNFLDIIPIAHLIPRKFAKMDGTYQVGAGKTDYDFKFLDKEDNVDLQLLGWTRFADKAIEATIKVDGEKLGPAYKPVLGPDGTVPVGLGGTLDHPRPEFKLAPANLIQKGIQGLLGGSKENKEETAPAEGGQTQSQPQDKNPVSGIIQGIFGN